MIYARIRCRQKISELMVEYEKYFERFRRLERTIGHRVTRDMGYFERWRTEIIGLFRVINEWFESVATELVNGRWAPDRAQALAWLNFHGGRVAVAGAVEMEIERLRRRYDWMSYDDAKKYGQIENWMQKHEDIKARLVNLDVQDFVNVPLPQKGDADGMTVLQELSPSEIAEKLRGLNASVGTADELKRKVNAIYAEACTLYEKLSQQVKQDQKQSTTLLTDAIETNKRLQNKFADIDRQCQELQKHIGENIDKILSQYNVKCGEYVSQLEGFLDPALAKGLSAAYREKIKKETKRYVCYSICFYVALGVLAMILLTPALMIKFWFHHVPAGYWKLFVLLPLEIPTVWLLFLFSKRANIAYRLEEDYTHKKMVGLVYQGVRKQIESLGETNVEDAKRLQSLLMQTVITAAAKNSGELIRGFNRPDCPVTDVLDRIGSVSVGTDGVKIGVGGGTTS